MYRCCSRIDVSESIDVNKITTSKLLFPTIGIFYIKGLDFNQLSVAAVTSCLWCLLILTILLF